MDAAIKEALARGKRVGLALLGFQTEIGDYEPLQLAASEVAAIVLALEEKEAAQDIDTTAPTTGKDQRRDEMARAAEALSGRMTGYALVRGDLELKQKFALTYADIRYGDADEDVNAVRELAKQARNLPADVRRTYRITDPLVTAAEDSAKAFEGAGASQTTTKADARLARLSAPELVTRLLAQFEIIRRLLVGMKSEGGRWQDLHAAFRDAAKVRKEPAERRLPQVPRVVKKLGYVRPDNAAFRLDKQNYGPAYELEVKNLSPGDLLLWMGFDRNPAGPAPATAVRCPAGQTTKLRRDALGPELARYLTGQFVEMGGGEVKVKVRRVVA